MFCVVFLVMIVFCSWDCGFMSVRVFVSVGDKVFSVPVRVCFVWQSVFCTLLNVFCMSMRVYFLSRWECVFCHLECVLSASESKFSISLRVCSVCQWKCILYVSVNVCMLVRVCFICQCFFLCWWVFCVPLRVGCFFMKLCFSFWEYVL